LLIFSSKISPGAGIPLQARGTYDQFISIDTTTTDTGSDNSTGTDGETGPLTQHDNEYPETQVVEPEEVSGYDIRTIQELMGHKDVSTTMIYTYVLNKGGHGVRSPIDGP